MPPDTAIDHYRIIEEGNMLPRHYASHEEARRLACGERIVAVNRYGGIVVDFSKEDNTYGVDIPVDPIVYQELVEEMCKAMDEVLKFQKAAEPETCTVLGSVKPDARLAALHKEYGAWTHARISLNDKEATHGKEDS